MFFCVALRFPLCTIGPRLPSPPVEFRCAVLCCVVLPRLSFLCQGSAVGFKLASLGRLQEIKTSESKMSLLEVIVDGLVNTNSKVVCYLPLWMGGTPLPGSLCPRLYIHALWGEWLGTNVCLPAPFSSKPVDAALPCALHTHAHTHFSDQLGRSFVVLLCG